MSLSLKPKKINLTGGSSEDEAWYYEENKGILVIHRVNKEGNYVKTSEILIPWRSVLSSVENYIHKRTGEKIKILQMGKRAEVKHMGIH